MDEFQKEVIDRLARIETKQDAMPCIERDKRLTSIENKVNYGGGFIACIMALIGYLK